MYWKHNHTSIIRLKNYKLANLDHMFNWIFKVKWQERKSFKTES